MTCEKFNNLTPVEKVIFIGKLVHCVQSDNEAFSNAEYVIARSERNGVLDGIKILPPNGEEENNDKFF